MIDKAAKETASQTKNAQGEPMELDPELINNKYNTKINEIIESK